MAYSMASIHKTYNIQIAMNMRKDIVEDRNECMHMADTRIFIWANTCHLTFVDRHAMSKYVSRRITKRSFLWLAVSYILDYIIGASSLLTVSLFFSLSPLSSLSLLLSSLPFLPFSLPPFFPPSKLFSSPGSSSAGNWKPATNYSNQIDR